MNKKYSLVIITIIIASAFIGANSVLSASDMARAQRGKILLQVEGNGEAWYVNQSDEMRYYMGRPEDAFGLMRQLGVGISTADLERIKPATTNMGGIDSDGDGLSDMFEDAIGSDKNVADTDGDGYGDGDELKNGYHFRNNGKLTQDSSFAESQKGKIFLAVERNGEAWYINPEDGLRYFMGRPKDAFNLMRSLGLGISNANLEKIPVKDGKIVESSKEEVTHAPMGITNIVTAHQADIKEFVTVFDNDDYIRYYPLVEKLFTEGAQETAKEKVDDFFVAFVFEGLKSVIKADLENEYEFAVGDEETALPYEQTGEDTVVVALGLEEAMPYEIKKVGDSWKIDLSYAQKYYNEQEKIEDMEIDSEGSETDIYILGKVKAALKEYKTDKGSYPMYLPDLASYYPSLKNNLEFFYYSTWDGQSKCHIGIEVYDDEKVLNNDADFDSTELMEDFGFDGMDPVYDQKLE